MEQLKSWAHHGGVVRRYRHVSTSTGTTMNFVVFLPPQALGEAAATKVPVVYFLAGLECTDETFAMKGGAFAHAAKAGLAFVCPDTSPRGAGVPGEAESWDFGVGAGFYVDATQAPWSAHWRMFSYVTAELPSLIAAHLPIDTSRASIMGHSMGGLGALICALKTPAGTYRAVTAFAPISNPSECPWGVKAFSGYLGADRSAWLEWDPTHLVAAYAAGPTPLRIRLELGTADHFYAAKQLLPEHLIAAAATAAGVELKAALRECYDHSYYFISTFVGGAVEEHAAALFA